MSFVPALSHESPFIAELQTAVREGTPAAYIRASRLLRESNPGLPEVRVAVLSTFTLNLVAPCLEVHGALAGYRVLLHFAPFQQLEQQTHDPASALYAFQPDLVFIAGLLEDLSPLRDRPFHSLTANVFEVAVEEIRDRFAGLAAAIRQHSAAHVTLFNFATPGTFQTGPSSLLLSHGPEDFLYRCNRSLRDIAAQSNGVSLFDYAAFVRRTGEDSWFDPKWWYLARQPLSRSALPTLASALARHLRLVRQPRKKCLVLDLDNTLWGGIVGEDGPGGIQFGDDYPGNTFRDFQKYLKMLRAEGVLLAIASKNNPDDVEQAFAQRGDFILRLDDFAATEIHWQDKAHSLRQIAQDLSIGLDSLVFFDDNPVERELVRTLVPEVTVIEVPASAEGYVAAVRESGLFDQHALSAEDLQRAGLYQTERERRVLQQSATSREEFLASLNMKAEIGFIDSLTLPRCAQLLGKTNQFNLTTRRHAETDVQHLINQGALAYWLRLEDRFGDLGLVGLAIAVPHAGTEWEIDSFLLSCRVLGREAETLLLRFVLNAIQAQGGDSVRGVYLPTAKNAQTRDFYLQQEFQTVPDEDGAFKFRLIPGQPLALPECFTLSAPSQPLPLRPEPHLS